jgi:DNA-binding transcriptional LysR family regulator
MYIHFMNDVHEVAQVDLNLLVVLDALLRSRSTTVAARRLGRTQSAVSHALARLRDTLGDPIFVRVGSALQPTRFAEALEVPLREVLLRAEALLSRSDASFDPKRIERTFVWAGTDFAEMLIMPKLVPVLRREAPGAALVTRSLGNEVDRAIQSREIDLAFGARIRPLSGIATREVRTEGLVVLLRKGHPATRRKLSARRYAALDHVLVAPRGMPGGPADTALEALGLTRRVVLRVPHFAAAAFIVSQTDLVVTVPKGFVDILRPLDVVALALPFALPPLKFSIGYSTTLENDPAHRWFRERVLEAGRAS